MTAPHYERLSFLDSTFLALETPGSHMHVSAIALFDAGSLVNEEGGVDVEAIRQHVASRLHLVPRFRQSLRQVPIENHPVWVDDPHFNVDYHVRHSCLPRPGDATALKKMAGRIMAQKLDRARPLWEMWVVEGLQEGGRFAIISKVHHCVIDGVTGVDLMTVLLDRNPDSEVEKPRRWRPRPAPTPTELLYSEASRWFLGPANLWSNLPDAARELFDPRSDLRTRLRGVRDAVRAVQPISTTPLNVPIGPHRRFDWTVTDLEELKAVKRALGGTLNDVVLATVAGALRRFFVRRGFDLREIDFRVAAPVSVLDADDRGIPGNRISAWLVPLPIAEPDPRLRVRRISEVTDRLGKSKQALGAQSLAAAGEWAPATLLSLGARIATRSLPFNLVVTNVPGPQHPLYLLDSRLVANFGQVPLADRLALGLAIFSYDGSLYWGLNGDWEAVPDLADFASDLEHAVEEMRQGAATAVALDRSRPA